MYIVQEILVAGNRSACKNENHRFDLHKGVAKSKQCVLGGRNKDEKNIKLISQWEPLSQGSFDPSAFPSTNEFYQRL